MEVLVRSNQKLSPRRRVECGFGAHVTFKATWSAISWESHSLHPAEVIAGSVMVSTVMILDAKLHETLDTTIFLDSFLFFTDNASQGSLNDRRIAWLVLIDNIFDCLAGLFHNHVRRLLLNFSQGRLLNDGDCSTVVIV